MVAMQSPLTGMQFDEQTGRYIGVLERQVMGLTLNEMKYQALLELLTEQPWESLKHDLEADKIRHIAIDCIKLRLGVSDAEARRIVRAREADIAKMKQE